MCPKLKNIAEILKESQHIYIIGNGESASLSDHFACDLLKNCTLPAISLCSNQTLITAIANDDSFLCIFRLQLEVLFRSKDVLVVLSTRGNSPNLVEAARYISTRGKVIGIAGYDGGKLEDYCDIFYDLNAYDMQECEDKMNVFCHEIMKILRKGRI